MCGKGLQVVDRDVFLPVAHLDGEEVRVVAENSVGAVIQWGKGGVVCVAADQYAFQVVQRVRDSFRCRNARWGVVSQNCRCCRIAGDAQRLQCLFQRQLRGERILAVHWRVSGMR